MCGKFIYILNLFFVGFNKIVLWAGVYFADCVVKIPPRAGSVVTTGRCLSRWNLEVSKCFLCFITMLKSPPKVGICTLLGATGAMCKEVWKTAHARLPLEISTPFLESVSWPWKFPDCPPPEEKVPLEHELPLSILWRLNKSLSCLHQTQFRYWHYELGWERTPWPS